MDEKSLAVLSETVRNTLKKANLLIRANNIVDVDMMTACPEKGVEEAGEVSAALGGDIFALFHSDGFHRSCRRALQAPGRPRGS